MQAIEPGYKNIPAGVLRRMGKIVRMGTGAAMQILNQTSKPDGIIIGTSNGGKEDCIRFLNQIVDYDEGVLSPLNFVQSTPNAVAAQIGLLTENHGYNISHLQLGLAFENAIIDTDLLLEENPANQYLLGAVDDLASYNFEKKTGWYKDEPVSTDDWYDKNSAGTVAGEGAAMFLASTQSKGSLAQLVAVDSLQHLDENILKLKLRQFIQVNLPKGEKIDLLLSGENGDNRLKKYYQVCESLIDSDVAIARFKHLSGEYPTATALALWLCCTVFKDRKAPDHLFKRKGVSKEFKHILIYNNYQLLQHSFMLISL